MNTIGVVPARTGETLLNSGQAEQALPHLRKQALECPTNAAVWTNLGICYRLLNLYQESVDSFERALQLKPDSALTIFNFGNLLTDIGEFDKAFRAYEKAFQLNPQRQELALAYSYALLREGRWEAAWPLYEFGRYRRSWHEPPGLPLWNGEALEGKRILVVPEGGYGDTFQMLPYVGKLKEMGGIVTMVVRDQLIPILRDHEFIDHLIATSEEFVPGDYDCCTSILSIIALLNTKYSDDLWMGRGLAKPYLRWRHGRGNEIHDDNGELVVGICWAAEEAGSFKKYRSLDVADLEPLNSFSREHVRFVSLMPPLTEKPSWIENCPADGWVETAELIQNLDLVVTVDTAVAHLAGALKKQTWILLPPGSEWRWFREGVKSPWYPTANILRSTFDGGGLRALIPDVRNRIANGLC